MNRRDFFKLTGLGAGTLLLTPALLSAAWTDQWQAQDAVRFAVDHALRCGATYADARIGTCDLMGHGRAFTPVELLQTDLLGMRVCTAAGWRQLVLRDISQQSIARQLEVAVLPDLPLRTQKDHWISAHFCKEKVLAHHTSDAQTESELNMAWLRFGTRPPLPEDKPEILFCDILLHQ
jgi:hypothetical protein